MTARLHVRGALLAVAPLLLLAGCGGGGVRSAPADSVDDCRPSAAQLKRTATIALPAVPTAVTADARGAWVALADGRVGRVDAATGALRGTPTHVGGRPTALAAGGGRIWVAQRDSGRVVALDARTGRRQRGRAAIDVPADLAVTPEAGLVFAVSLDDGLLIRLDPANAAQVGLGTQVPALAPAFVAYGDGQVWVGSASDGSLTRADPVNGRLLGDPVDVGIEGMSAMVVDGDVVWIADGERSLLQRVSTSSARPFGEPLTTVDAPTAVAVGGCAVFVAGARGEVQRIDREVSDEARVRAGRSAGALAYGDHVVWVTDPEARTLVRVAVVVE